MQGRLTLAKSAVICENSGDQYIGGAGLGEKVAVIDGFPRWQMVSQVIDGFKVLE